MERLTQNQIEIPTYEQAPDSAEIANTFYKKMATRRTIRQFSSAPIDREILLNAIKTAGTAPSGANLQPWHFALITSPNIKEKIRIAAEAVEHEFYSQKASADWLNDLKPLGTTSSKPYLSEAPALIAVFSQITNKTDGEKLSRTYYPTESTGIAVGFLLASLHNSGLATLTHTPKPMYFLNEVLNLDRGFRPFMIIVTGYPKEPIRVPDIHRKPLSQILTEY